MPFGRTRRMSADDVAILRIELDEIEPLIWRRVGVRASSSLNALHRIIQITMGWLDYHLWEFEIDDVTYGVPDPEGNDWGYQTKPATRTKLAKVINLGVDQFSYTYDMGDNWLHRIFVERIEPADPDVIYPCFLGGQRRCPPEDCGSVPGYYDFIDAISAPGKGRRKKREMLSWYGRTYDPNDIEEERIKAELARLAYRPRRKPTASDKA
jgi:Plasmid pRiA4b ORF-3-like protein